MHQKLKDCQRFRIQAYQHQGQYVEGDLVWFGPTVALCKKLKDCQRFRTQAYQHLGRYVESDLVCFQNLNANEWLGPVVVLCHRGQSVWLHTHGDIKKVAA